MSVIRWIAITWDIVPSVEYNGKPSTVEHSEPYLYAFTWYDNINNIKAFYDINWYQLKKFYVSIIVVLV